jgi:hypothetical protein
MAWAPWNGERRVRGWWSRCACKTGRTARRMGADRIEADRADCACMASHRDAWVQRRGRDARAGRDELADRGRLRGCLYTRVCSDVQVLAIPIGELFFSEVFNSY